MQFRKVLVQRRQDEDITQVELAKMLDRPQQFVSRYELGERRLDVCEFLEIAECLNIEPSSFIADLNDWRKTNQT